MIIIDKRTSKPNTNFDQLTIWDVFEFKGSLYIKIDYSNTPNNAFNLSKEQKVITTLIPEDEVTLLKTTLIIEEQ